MSETAVSEGQSLPRTLGFWDACCLIAGSVIGSGIFLVTSDIAAQVHLPELILLVWVLAGCLSFCGALSYAELGCLFPRAGGPYVFLREAFGPVWGYLFGWAMFGVIHTGSIAAVSVAFGRYLGEFFPFMEGVGVKVAAVAAILILTAVNALSTRCGASAQNLMTGLKLAALCILGFVTLAFGKGVVAASPSHSPEASGMGLLGAFGLAMIAALWAYDGWGNLTFTAGEIRDPGRNIPRSLFLGVGVVTLLYCVTNMGYLHVLPLDRIIQSQRVASDAAQAVLGLGGGKWISAAILVSTLGCVNGMILAGPRIYYAMARDGLFFKGASGVHPRFLTPFGSVVAQGLWAVVLTLSGRYDELFTYVMFAAWIFYGLTVAALFVFRARGMESPYRAWGYPWVPAVFVAASGFLVLNTLHQRPRESLLGLGIMLAGLPFFFFLKNRRKEVEYEGSCDPGS
ncbi:MAG: amino acid permease [Armatimonadetes bacterium]|nr:amino acid permease [Armatimonadota bacterium]